MEDAQHSSVGGALVVVICLCCCLASWLCREQPGGRGGGGGSVRDLEAQLAAPGRQQPQPSRLERPVPAVRPAKTEPSHAQSFVTQTRPATVEFNRPPPFMPQTRPAAVEFNRPPPFAPQTRPAAVEFNRPPPFVPQTRPPPFPLHFNPPQPPARPPPTASATSSASSSWSQSQSSISSKRRLRVFHGTSAQASWQIWNSGIFIPSKKGLYGPKVYFSKNLQKAQQFGPYILECEVDKRAVTQIEERGGIVYCDNFEAANGSILQVFRQRDDCSSANQCCETECRQCRNEKKRHQLPATRREAREERKKTILEQWKWCPGVGGSPCIGDEWCHVKANVCKACKKRPGARRGRR